MKTLVRNFIIIIVIYCKTTSYAQEYKYSLTHNITANDFISAVSDTSQGLTQMPKGMSLALTRHINKSIGISLPIRVGFGKASFDTMGRIFFATDILLVHELLRSKYLLPVLSIGTSVQNLSKEWDLGIPIGIGINIPVDDGLFFNIQTAYRHSFIAQRHSWHHGIGLNFRLNNNKRNHSFPIFVDKNNTNIIRLDDIDINSYKEEFNADDTIAQAKIIVPSKKDDTINYYKIQDRILIDNDFAKNTIYNQSIKNTNSSIKSELIKSDDNSVQESHIQISINSTEVINPEMNKTMIDTTIWHYAGTIYFPFDKYSYVNLEEDILQIISNKQKNHIHLVGYTDSIGSIKYNNLLSKKRAEMCRDILLKNGYNNIPIAINYYGENYPKMSNNTSKGRTLNRRVEIWTQ